MKFEIVRNDIANVQADAIVLPANARLLEGKGASAAIFEKAGRRELTKACRGIIKERGKITAEYPALTLGYNLNADYIIHTLVPHWIDGNHNEYERLSTAYFSALTLADIVGCKSIAFPLLASGNNKFDFKLAFEIARKSIETFKAKHNLKRVLLVIYGYEITAYLKESGYVIKDEIDEKYVLKKKDEDVGAIQKAYDKAKQAITKFFGNPDNVKMLIDIGEEVFDMVKEIDPNVEDEKVGKALPYAINIARKLANHKNNE